MSIELELSLDGTEARSGFALSATAGPLRYRVAREELTLAERSEGFAIEGGKWLR